ncbi:hypothetical protein BaRGS_00019558 [Batillaria attramentaria]|uniref:Uncharacterized protein n=1 Tax=Batillaria attramentaria TaxID=370345 RepID=A0ABD0KPL5_9CAEN
MQTRLKTAGLHTARQSSHVPEWTDHSVFFRQERRGGCNGQSSPFAPNLRSRIEKPTRSQSVQSSTRSRQRSTCHSHAPAVIAELSVGLSMFSLP